MNAVIMAMRPSFLLLTPACVSVGLATASVTGAAVNWTSLCLILVGALAAHIAVNTLNEYQDFRSGLDLVTSRTPFSGGSGALVANPEAAREVLAAALLSLTVTVSVGLFFVIQLGPAILPLGMAGIILIVLYTGWLNRRPWLCVVAPGLAFGPLMVVGTHLVLTGRYSVLAVYASLVPFLLVNNLLLLNQYPDLKADRQAGRRHLPITYGVAFSTRVYGAMVAIAITVVVAGVIMGWLPGLCLLALVPVSAAGVAYWGARRHAYSTEHLQPFLGWNVVAATGSPLVLAITLAVG